MILRLACGLAVIAGAGVAAYVVGVEDGRRDELRRAESIARLFYTRPQEGEDALRKAVRLSADPHRLLEEFRPALRELAAAGADRNAYSLLAIMWDAGLHDAEIVELEEALYRRTQLGQGRSHFPGIKISLDPVILGDRLILFHKRSMVSELDLKAGVVSQSVDLHVPIHSEALLVDGRVIFASVSGALSCRNADLSEAWTAKVASRFYDPPLLCSDGARVYALWKEGAGSRLRAVALADGAAAWGPIDLDDGDPRFAAVSEGWVAAGARRLHAVQAESGAVAAAIGCKTPLAPGVVISGTRAVAADASEAFAVHLSTGAKEWGRPLPAPPALAPVALRGRVVFALANGEVICLSLMDGRPLWTTRVHENLRMPMVASRDRVYIVDGERHLHQIMIEDGSTADLGLDFMAGSALAPLLSGGRLIMFDDNLDSNMTKIHLINTGDRKAGGWTQKGGGPGRTNLGAD